MGNNKKPNSQIEPSVSVRASAREPVITPTRGLKRKVAYGSGNETIQGKILVFPCYIETERK